MVNNHPVQIFRGALAGDAILAYSRHSFRRLLKGSLGIFDRFGNKTSPDGALKEGSSIYLKKIKNHE